MTIYRSVLCINMYYRWLYNGIYYVSVSEGYADMNDFYADTGRRIKEKRIALRLSRDKLAVMAKISDKFLYDIETGHKGMSAETLYKLAQALEVSMDWLVSGY